MFFFSFFNERMIMNYCFLLLSFFKNQSDNLVYMKGSSITSTRNKRHDYSKLISPENQINYEEIDLTGIDLDVEYYEIGTIRSSSNLDQLLHL